MKLSYDDLLKDFNELKECVRFFFGNLEENGIKVLFKYIELETCSLSECEKFKKPTEIIFDFSEHDKIFEDKIAKLKKENAKVYQENMHLEKNA